MIRELHLMWRSCRSVGWSRISFSSAFSGFFLFFRCERYLSYQQNSKNDWSKVSIFRKFWTVIDCIENDSWICFVMFWFSLFVLGNDPRIPVNISQRHSNRSCHQWLSYSARRPTRKVCAHFYQNDTEIVPSRNRHIIRYTLPIRNNLLL